jgi:hypothetical protein
MPRPGQPVRQAKRGRFGSLVPSAFAFLLTFLLGSLLAGCNGLHKKDNPDPLLGPGPQGLKTPDTPPAKTSALVPPVPPTNSSASTADLAAGQLTGGRPLNIDDGNRLAGWEGVGPDGRPVHGSTAGGIKTAGGVTLQQPEPLQGQPGSSGPLIPVPVYVYGQQPQTPPTQAAPPTASIEQLEAQVKAHGGTILSNEVRPGGVFIRCAAPKPGDPTHQLIYEVTGPTPQAALQALLDRIGQGR